MNRSNGFTLIELMITVAMAAIVLTLGVPSFQEIIRNNRLATQTNAFVGALSLARSEAVKRGVRVTLCKSANGADCAASGGYEQGWIVFVDSANTATRDGSEEIIRVYGAITNMNLTITGNINVLNYVSYTADGMSKQAGTLTVNPTVCQAPKNNKAREIIINMVGRVTTGRIACTP